MKNEIFCRAWDSVTLSPEADAKIRQSLSCHLPKPTPSKRPQKLSKLLPAAALSILLLAVTAGAVAISRLELCVEEEHTAYSDHYDVFLSAREGEETPLGFWYPEALPGDFAPVYVSDLRESSCSILFQNEQGDQLELTWCSSSIQLLASTRGSSNTQQSISVNGAEGYRFDHERPEELGLTACTLLCWTAPDTDAAFRLEYRGISGSTPDLLTIAESVAPRTEPLTPSSQEALEAFGDWRITALPEPYVYDGAYCAYLEELSAEDHPYEIHQTYLAEDGAICLRYSPIPSGSTADDALDNATAFFRSERTSVGINGANGYYVNSPKAAVDYLFWADKESGLLFTLWGEVLSPEEAIALAESTAKE